MPDIPAWLLPWPSCWLVVWPDGTILWISSHNAEVGPIYWGCGGISPFRNFGWYFWKIEELCEGGDSCVWNGRAWRRWESSSGWDLNKEEAIVDIAEQLLEEWHGHVDFGMERLISIGLEGISLIPERRKTDGISSSDWVTMLKYDRLINAIWYQVHRAIVLKSRYRLCRNEQCKNPEACFEPVRLDQLYCHKFCRGANNARKHRQRTSKPKDKRTDGTLPW